MRLMYQKVWLCQQQTKLSALFCVLCTLDWAAASPEDVNRSQSAIGYHYFILSVELRSQSGRKPGHDTCFVSIQWALIGNYGLFSPVYCLLHPHSIVPPSAKIWTLVTATLFEKRIIFVRFREPTFLLFVL